MGHSFGGATVIEALCKEVKFKYVSLYSHYLFVSSPPGCG